VLLSKGFAGACLSWALLANTGAYAADFPGIKNIALDNVNNYGRASMGANPECELVYIKKADEYWRIAQGQERDVSNPNVEVLRACPARGDSGYVDTVKFELDFRDLCSTYQATETTPNRGVRTVERYQSRSDRTRGYFACNSGFTNKKDVLVFAKGLDFDNPVNRKMLQDVVDGPDFKIFSSNLLLNFSRGKFGKLMTNPAIKVEDLVAFMGLYGPYIEESQAASLAEKYAQMSGEIEFPRVISSRVSEVELNKIQQNQRNSAITLYRDRLGDLMKPGADVSALQAFVWDIDVENPKKWSQIDFDKVLPVMKERLVKQNKAIRDQFDKREKAMLEESKNRRVALVKLVEDWRRQVKEGEDTFCGPVIEMKGNMLRLALNAPLQGYSNEIWVKKSDAYPPEFGCRNVNGRVSPLNPVR